MYNGYDRSPKNLHIRFVNLFVVFSEAPNHTRSGKNITQHTVSYNPFIQRCSVPPIRGMAKSVMRIKLHIQKAPFILSGLKTRKRSNPAENENINLKNPAVNSVPVKENPAQISP